MDVVLTLGAKRDSTQWRQRIMSWADLTSQLSTPTRTRESYADYKALTKPERDAIKDIGGFVAGILNGERRTKKAVYSRSMVTLDMDDVDKIQWDPWDEWRINTPWAACLYSTHSHCPEHPRYRLIIPLSRHVSPEEYEPIARWLASLVGIDAMDKTTYELNRLMYWPSVARDGAWRYECTPEGTLICDPDEVLAAYGGDGAWMDTARWPTGDGELEARRGESKVLGSPLRKGGIVGLFCRCFSVGEAIERFLPGVYVPVDGDEYGRRYTYAAGSTAGGAVVYQGEDGGEWLYSHHATDPCGDGHLHNAFDLVRIHLFRERDEGQRVEDVTKLHSWAAMVQLCEGLPELKELALAERAADFADLTDSDVTSVAGAAGEGYGITALTVEQRSASEHGLCVCSGGTVVVPPPPDGEGWTARLSFNTKTQVVEPSARNLDLIVRNDDRLRGRIGYDGLAQRPVLLGPVPWREWRPKRQGGGGGGGGLEYMDWTDADDGGVRGYIETVYGVVCREKVKDAVALERERRTFHPVREYLERLGEWDGVERLDTMLVRWMGAEDTELTRKMTRKWMCGAVKRALEPGCKMDAMLVLVGPQGIGKGRLGEILSRGWFCASLQTFAGKEAMEQIQGAWIVEVPELGGLKHSDIETMKQFVTATSDYYRPSYGAYAFDHMRQCVLYGDSNELGFLKDKTGNRRFWPVLCAGVNDGWHVGLEDEVDQLWAEAKWRLSEGEVLALTTADEKAMLSDAQELFTIEDDLAEELREWVERPLPDCWLDWSEDQRVQWSRGLMMGADQIPCTLRRTEITRRDVKLELLGVDVRDSARNGDLSYRITDALDKLPGWKKDPRRKRHYEHGASNVYRRNGAFAFPVDHIA